MAILYIVIISFCVAVMIWSVAKIIRNNKVYKFRRKIADLDWDYFQRTGEVKDFYKRLPSYYEMMKGSEPIRLESYFTYDEIKELITIEETNKRLQQ